MLRTMAIQHGVRAFDSAPAREFDPAVSSLIDRNAQTIVDTEALAAAVDRLLAGAAGGVPVVDAGGRYRGMCTFRSVSSLGLLLNGETAALMPSLGFLRDDLERIRQRMESSLAMPAVQAIDPFVPTLLPSATLPEIFFQFYRGHFLLPVVDGETRRFMGAISCERVLGAALRRTAADGR